MELPDLPRMRYASLALLLPLTLQAQTPLECSDWRFVESAPTGLTDGNLVYDPIRGELLCLGAALSPEWDAPWNSGMFRWSGESWQPIDVPHPAFLRSDKAAFDESRGVVVLIHHTALWDAQVETWEWDGRTWSLREEIGGTTPEAHWAAITYDPGRGRVVLFGQTGAVFDSLLRTWDGRVWTTEPVPGPSVGDRMVAVPDVGRGTLLLIVSRNLRVQYWEHDGQVCTLRATYGSLEPSQAAASLPDGSGVLIPNDFHEASFYHYQNGVVQWTFPLVCTSSESGPLTHLFTDRLRGVMIAVKQPYRSMLPGIVEFGPPRAYVDTLATYTPGQQTFSFIACGGMFTNHWFRDGEELQRFENRFTIPVDANFSRIPTRYWCVVSNACGEARSAVAVIPGSRCLADYDMDGFVDLFDYIAFTENAPNYVDANGDGERDVEDLLTFIEAFERGCN